MAQTHTRDRHKGELDRAPRDLNQTPLKLRQKETVKIFQQEPI